VFGPVLNPSSPHGLASIEVEYEEQVPKLIAEDPAAVAGIMTTEFYNYKPPHSFTKFVFKFR
jgi:hypothetical protein